jgi:cell division protein ZapD
MSACEPFLRLEFLYTQAYHSESENPWSTRSAVASLLEILAITARGDSRNDVLKELERQVKILKEYQTKTGVDPSRLKSLMANLVKLRDDLSDRSAAISWRRCAIRSS